MYPRRYLSIAGCTNRQLNLDNHRHVGGTMPLRTLIVFTILIALVKLAFAADDRVLFSPLTDR